MSDSTYYGYPPVQSMVREFHERFNQPVLEQPKMPRFSRRMLRRKLLAEEAAEFDHAVNHAELVEAVDAIADSIYVLYGAALEFGVDMGPVMAEVHRSNMAKVWPDGTVRTNEAGKILKPHGWTPPDIAGVLKKQGWTP